MAFDAYFRFAIALVFVLALIGLLAWLAKRFGVAGAFARPRASRRLSVEESLPLDARHRLILVRRDTVEHLVLLGTGGDSLIESNIEPPPEPAKPAVVPLRPANGGNQG